MVFTSQKICLRLSTMKLYVMKSYPLFFNALQIIYLRKKELHFTADGGAKEVVPSPIGYC